MFQSGRQELAGPDLRDEIAGLGSESVFSRREGGQTTLRGAGGESSSFSECITSLAIDEEVVCMDELSCKTILANSLGKLLQERL